MFIVDALIGNWDRHNDNWGFLYNITTDEISLAPIYDCGSCLFPQANEEIMRKTLEIVDETPFISDLQKEFYKTMLRERKERILDFSYKKLCKRERSKSQEYNVELMIWLKREYLLCLKIPVNLH